jgi:hypothetical protein
LQTVGGAEALDFLTAAAGSVGVHYDDMRERAAS